MTFYREELCKYTSVSIRIRIRRIRMFWASWICIRIRTKMSRILNTDSQGEGQNFVVLT